MSKKKIEKLQKEYTKPQVSRWERQKMTQRLVFFGGIGLIVVVVLGLVAAWYFTNPLFKTVLAVNGQKVSMSQYVKTLRATSKGYSESDLPSVAYSTYMELIKEEVITQGAKEQKITVSDDEVNAYIKDNNLDAGFAPIVREKLLSDKLTEDYFKPQVAKTGAQRDIEAMFLESEAQANTIRAKLEAGESFTNLAVANSLDDYSETNKGQIGWHVQQVFQSLLGSSVPGDFAFADSTQNGQLSQARPDTDKQKKVGYWLIMLIEKGTGDKEGQVNVRAMLLSSEEEAQSIKDQLAQITDPAQLNTEFSTLANEKSQYDTGGQNGGLIGFISKGTINSTVFDNAAFSLEVGAVSEPIIDTSQTTKGGFWLVKVLDSASDKELSTDDIDTIVSDMFNNWFLQEQSAATIDYLLDETNMYWAISKVTGS